MGTGDPNLAAKAAERGKPNPNPLVVEAAEAVETAEAVEAVEAVEAAEGRELNPTNTNPNPGDPPDKLARAGESR